VVPYSVASLVVLLVIDALEGRLAGDWSKTGFADLMLAIPLGMLVLFLTQFLKFTRDPGESAPATA
jgi:hypothetical protein